MVVGLRRALILGGLTLLTGCPDAAGPAGKTKTTPAASPSKTAAPTAKTIKTKPRPPRKTRRGPRPIPLVKRPVRITKRPEPAKKTPDPKPTDGPQRIDLAKVVRAPARLQLGEGVKVGFMARQETRGPGYRASTWTAVVGEDDGRWRVEHVPYGIQAYEGLTPEASKMILGLTVSKVDGTVIKAVIGKPDEQGRPIRIFELPADEQGPGAGKRVELKVGGGTLPALLREETLEGFGTVRTWTGVDALAGVVLKSVDPKKQKQLKALPTRETTKVGGVALSVQKCVYDNGDVTLVTDHPVVRALFDGVVSVKSGEMTLSLTALATDAKPRLEWD